MDAVKRKYLRADGTYPPLAGADPVVDDQEIVELEQRQADIASRLGELDDQFRGQAMSAEGKGEWNSLMAEREENQKVINELKVRSEQLRALAKEPVAREEAFGQFHTARPGAIRGSDVWDLSQYRSAANSREDEVRALKDGAKRAMELTGPAHERADENEAQRQLERILERAEDEHGTISRRILNTGSPLYKRAFGKHLAGAQLMPEEARALSTASSGGGYAVPFQLDPTVIPTSNSVVNPLRRISRTEQMAGSKWQGVTSAGVTASFGAEAAEASDNAPTLGQPEIEAEKATAFIPFSIEIGQDWTGLQGSLAELLSDAKDECEATAFLTGTGTDEPFGLLTGATTNVSSAGSAAFAVADVYAVEEALGPRFRPLAQWVANRYIYNKARQFDTAGGASLFVDNLRLGLNNDVGGGAQGGNTGTNLIGYAANELSTMDAAITANKKIAVLGDFRHYLIADRVGLDIEVIPHLMGSNRRPTGQRGLYAYWRTGAKVLVPGAFRVLITK